ncbi:MAG: hypothetical protein PHR60_04715 [Eubacteriales bacterium]|nr:hypothetical protein [Eubacteriales bacterium]
MKTILKIVVLWLIVGILATGCSNQNTDFTLQVTPPQNLKFPLQGTWEIVSLLKESAPLEQESVQQWEGKNLYFTNEFVLLGEYLLSKPGYQVKKVESEAYMLYYHQAYPENFRFNDEEIEILTLYEGEQYFCEFVRVNEDEVLLNFLSSCFIVKKISDEVDETTLSFPRNTDLSGLGKKTESISDQTGVLIGLRAPDQNSHGNEGESYRTLWIAMNKNELAPVLETDTIIFPRRSGFYQLEAIRRQEGNKEEDFLYVNNILLNDNKDEDEDEDKDNSSFLSANWGGKEGFIHRKVHYIGNDYVSIEETVNQANVNDNNLWEDSKLQIIAVDSLPNIKAVKIADLVGPNGVSVMEQGNHKFLKQLGIKQLRPLEEDNFGLVRKMGYWIFNGRLDYSHNNEYMKADYNIGIVPPNNVVLYNELKIPWARVKNYIPSAIDVFTSPNKDLALVVTDEEIIIYAINQENFVGPPLEKITLKEGEKIIMAEWASGNYVENWALTFEAWCKRQR